VQSIVWEEETRPLVVTCTYSFLGNVANAWLLDGIDPEHVRVYAPDLRRLDGNIGAFLLSQFTFMSGSHPGGLPVSVDRYQ
jgi:hypothetical protein